MCEEKKSDSEISREGLFPVKTTLSYCTQLSILYIKNGLMVVYLDTYVNHSFLLNCHIYVRSYTLSSTHFF